MMEVVVRTVGGGEMVVLGLMKARVDGGEMVVLGLMKARVDGEGASEGRVKAVVLEWEDGVQLDKVWLSERLGVGEENDEGRGWRLGVVAVGDDFSSVEFGHVIQKLNTRNMELAFAEQIKLIP
ncbi:hypothetical protein V6N12_010626 [Hibiscus sabdariffa]|uniref:Uncharacterized protein n=1 Tax=Hibiscus sabdariffa TaxID=183260 RepID=A0ABR2EL09_9ROSI